MAAVTRIKVKRETLLERLRKSRSESVATHERAEEKYGQQLGDFFPKLRVELETLAALCDEEPSEVLAKLDGDFRGKVKVSLSGRLKLPAAPKLDTRAVDRLIAVLEAAEDETISIAADDDYSRFL